MDYHLLDRSEIDLEKWNAVVSKTPYHSPYALSWYLDAATDKKWKALIRNDYELIMPLPYKSRFGLKQIYQPPLSQQLGVFGQSLNERDIKACLKSIPCYFQPIVIPMNAIIPPLRLADWNISPKTNYTLHLNKSYKKIRAGYTKGFKSHINKNKPELIVEKFDDLENMQNNFENGIGKRIGLSKREMAIGYKILKTALDHRKAFMLQVSSSNGQWLAQIYCLQTPNRIVKVRAISNDEGKKTCAMHVGIDHIIEKHSGRDIIFDFEGSSIPGVASFFRGFGPDLKPYHLYEKKSPIQNAYNFWLKIKRSR
jgi:hypothetical protein